jgi:hypothetical protein
MVGERGGKDLVVVALRMPLPTDISRFRMQHVPEDVLHLPACVFWLADSALFSACLCMGR